jgi:CRISPR-associated exonuclease Cas4
MEHSTEKLIISIASLNQFVFCPRRCALMFVEGIWEDNAHTAKGTLLHEHTDEAGYETDGNAKLLRALPLFSNRYGLSGKADIVEIHQTEIIPVEYKKGKKRRFGNDDIQLCAQGLCLEEMVKNSPLDFERCGLKRLKRLKQTNVERGFIYHAASRRRREVIFDESLRLETVKTIERVRLLLQAQIVPPAELKPRCDGCSLRGICLPELSDPNQLARTIESLKQ